jgi:ParB family transcriptional regulator, chromosome partitioning protein
MQQQTTTPEFRTLAIDQLRESPTNPRRSFDEGKLQELAQSIRAQGILVPLIVREIEPGVFEVVAGARRFRAAQQAELFTVPVRVVELTDAEALELQLIENAIREDVHPYEEAMAYKALLETSEPRYDVASIALKTGRSLNHIYGRLRMAELIPEAAEVFQANQITAGHALLIARLPHDQQRQALEAAFREDWRSKEKHIVSVRELSQWIRENLMLTLADAVFDRDDSELVPAAGACVSCSKRTGANTALFDDFFPQDDRCLSASCFCEKVDAHIARQKQNIEGLVQITRAYYTSGNGEQVLTRNEYTVIEPDTAKDAERLNNSPCSRATSAIVVEGPGKRGEIVQVCADPECEVHGRPNRRADDKVAAKQREQEWERRQQECEKNRENNRRLLDGVLAKVPKSLSRADHEMLLFAIIDRLDYEDWDAITERYKIDTDKVREPDAAAFELRKKVNVSTDHELICMLVEITLLPSGYSDEELEAGDPLATAGRRYNISLTSKEPTTLKGVKRATTAPALGAKTRRAKAMQVNKNSAAKKAAKKGGAA